MRIVLLLAGFLSQAVAQQASDFPLHSVHIRGNKSLADSAIVSVSGLAAGQKVGKAELDSAKDKLLATGMFETVAFQFGPDADGQCCTAIFDVREITAVFPVQFENLPEPGSEILAYLKARNPLYGPKLPGTTQVIEYYARQVETFLASRNHPGKVIGSLVQTGKDEFKITFRTDAALPAVSAVTFTGNKEIASVKLQNAINDVAFGQPFTKDGFRQLLDAQVRPLYDAKGMVRVRFTSFTTEPDPRVKGVLVHVTVDEGKMYKLGQVSESTGDRDLVKLAKIKTGDTANFDEITEGLERVKTELRREGYMHVDGSVDREIDDKSLTVDVILKFEKGPQYKFGKLTIQGLDLDGEPAVRKMWGVAEGRPFNALYPKYFLDRVREDGIFDGLGETKAATQIDEKTHVVDVTLTFGSAPKAKPKKRPGIGGQTAAPDNPAKFVKRGSRASTESAGGCPE